MSEPQERRKAVLTEDDVTKIKSVMDESFATQFTRWAETIGYDVTTPESRSAIRDDHKFIRITRKAGIWIMGTVIVALIGAAAASAIAMGG